jgi:hypothetical protein
MIPQPPIVPELLVKPLQPIAPEPPVLVPILAPEPPVMPPQPIAPEPPVFEPVLAAPEPLVMLPQPIVPQPSVMAPQPIVSQPPIMLAPPPQLNGMMLPPLPVMGASTEVSQAASRPAKKRGRPPGSKNKKKN